MTIEQDWIVFGKSLFLLKKRKMSRYPRIQVNITINILSERHVIDAYNKLKKMLGKIELPESTFIKWLIVSVYKCLAEGDCEEIKVKEHIKELKRIFIENEELRNKVKKLESENDELRRKVEKLYEEKINLTEHKCKDIIVGNYKVHMCGIGMIVDWFSNSTIVWSKFKTRDELFEFLKDLLKYGFLTGLDIKRIQQ